MPFLNRIVDESFFVPNFGVGLKIMAKLKSLLFLVAMAFACIDMQGQGLPKDIAYLAITAGTAKSTWTEYDATRKNYIQTVNQLSYGFAHPRFSLLETIAGQYDADKFITFRDLLGLGLGPGFGESTRKLFDPKTGKVNGPELGKLADLKESVILAQWEAGFTSIARLHERIDLGGRVYYGRIGSQSSRPFGHDRGLSYAALLRFGHTYWEYRWFPSGDNRNVFADWNGAEFDGMNILSAKLLVAKKRNFLVHAEYRWLGGTARGIGPDDGLGLPYQYNSMRVGLGWFLDRLNPYCPVPRR